MGQQQSSQGRARRRPGYGVRQLEIALKGQNSLASVVCVGTVCSAPSGQWALCAVAYPGRRCALPHRHQLKDRYSKKAEVPSELVFAETFQLWKKELPHGHLNKGSECLEERFSSGC